MTRWDELWEKEMTKNLLSEYYEILKPVKSEGDRTQGDLIFWKDACFEMQTYKNELYDKLEALREGVKELLQYNYMSSCRADVEALIRDSSTSTNIEEET